MKQGSRRRQQNDQRLHPHAAKQIEFLEELVNGLAANGVTDAARHYGGEGGAPGWDRTIDSRFRRPALYPLSYGRIGSLAALSQRQFFSTRWLGRQVWSIFAVAWSGCFDRVRE